LAEKADEKKELLLPQKSDDKKEEIKEESTLAVNAS